MKTGELRSNIIVDHAADTPYFEKAESEGWTSVFWADSTVFRRMFDKLDLAVVTELACGQGRHAARIIERAGHITLVDPVPTNIAICRKRFAARTNATFVVNSGKDLRDIVSESQTSLFSYDAMVHFEPQDVIDYIFEISRVLVPGGLALLHYSNNEDNFQSYTSGARWRNFFSEKMMKAFGWRAGLSFIDSQLITWSEANDALTLLSKES